jgi:uncharacterized protein YbcV (DUF1398 family)
MLGEGEPKIFMSDSPLLHHLLHFVNVNNLYTKLCRKNIVHNLTFYIKKIVAIYTKKNC